MVGQNMSLENENQETSRRERRASKRRAEMLSVAAQLFAKWGYERTTLDMIAEELSVSPASLYYYVTGKEELFVEILKQLLLDVEEHVYAVISPHMSPDERLHALIVTHIERICANQQSSLLMDHYSAYFWTEDRSELPSISGRYRRFIEQMIVDGVEQKVFFPTEPKIAALTILGAMNMISRWYIPAGPLSSGQIGELCARQLVGGLLHPERSMQ